MSILIKGLNMPDESEVVTLQIWGNGFVERLEGYHAWLLSGVRAVPVPTPHGRLIDVDALPDGKLWAHPIDLNYVSSAPTIIEAEEGE